MSKGAEAIDHGGGRKQGRVGLGSVAGLEDSEG